MQNIKNFWNNEDGIETLEYAVIGAIVCAVALLIYGSGWGTTVKALLTGAASKGTPAL